MENRIEESIILKIIEIKIKINNAQHKKNKRKLHVQFFLLFSWAIYINKGWGLSHDNYLIINKFNIN